MIQLAECPQLKLIDWSLPGVEELEEQGAFALYESNWKWIDQTNLTPQELVLIEHLPQV